METVAVSDRRISVRPFLEQVDLICEGGVDTFVLREKDLSYGELVSLARDVGNICRSRDTEFCIDGPPSVAIGLGFSCVWVPYWDLEKNGRPDTETVWVSVHGPEEATEAEDLGADRVVFGNVFETSCKPGKPAAGTELLKKTVSSTSLPVYAIGGVNTDTAFGLKNTGITGVCMRSSLMEADDVRVIVSSM